MEYEISEIVSYKLNGYEQKVSIEGKSKDLPVVINLHGGPGSPFPFYVGSRGRHKEFTEDFILVCWDQLGSGINTLKIDDSFDVDSFVEMAKNLVKEMKAKFPGNKVFLFAISWGSVLSAKLVEKYPDIVDGVVSFGQIVKKAFINDEVIEALEQSEIPAKKLEQIKAIDIKKVSIKDFRLVSGAIMKYTEGYNNKKAEPDPDAPEFKDVFKSPDYSFREKLATVGLNGYMKNLSLLKAVAEIDLSDALTNVGIPYHVLQGETDIVASTKTVCELIRKAENPFLTVKVLENTAHIGGKGINDIIAAELKKLV